MNYQQLENLFVAQGCSTFSKRKDQYVENHPSHILESFGPKVLGSDNKWYIDCVCGLGSNLTDIKNNYCKPSIFEPLLAQAIKRKIKFIDKVKFLKTGSSACEAAVRIGRWYTGKKTVYGTGYHGCSNAFIAAEKPGVGCVSEGYVKFDSLSDLIANIQNSYKLDAKCDIGTVIIEPVQLDDSDSRMMQVQELREVCTNRGIVLIFDEIITGFRVPQYCYSQKWKIYPDLICFGKAMANGFPLACVAGKKDIMEMTGVFISNTHNGEESSLKESLSTVNAWTQPRLKLMWDRGGRFKKVVNKMLPKDKLQLVGYNTRGEWQGDEEFKAVFFEQMAIRGVLLGRAFFVTGAHDIQTYNKILDAVYGSLQAIKKGAVRKGYLPKAVFARN